MLNAALQNWLDIATRGLCEDAKARVRAEVEAHFAAAYEKVLCEGECEAVTRAWALATLGDPKKAARTYRRAYLTEGDEKTLAGINKRGPAILFTLRLLGVGAVIATVFQSPVVLLCCFWWLLSTPIVAFVLSPTRSELQSKLRSLMGLQIAVIMIQYVSIMLSLRLAIGAEFRTVSLLIMTIIWAVSFLPLPMWFVLTWRRLYLKVRHKHNRETTGPNIGSPRDDK